ncbi:hypothetical protein [Rossellomorea aquimaris]|nr:hypothetical protein [Rossellomorea aquimaris]
MSFLSWSGKLDGLEGAGVAYDPDTKPSRREIDPDWAIFNPNIKFSILI